MRRKEAETVSEWYEGRMIGKDRPYLPRLSPILADTQKCLRTMYYKIMKEGQPGQQGLRDRIGEEISHVADGAYSDAGVSLYDSVVLTDKDGAMVDRFIDDAVSMLVRRTFDICKYAPELIPDGEGGEMLSPVMRLHFFVPDFDHTMEDNVKTELDRYIVMYSVASILQQRRPALTPEYTDRAKAALDNAVTLLKSRKDPISW